MKKLTPIHREEEQGAKHDTLHVKKFKGMNGRDGKCSRLFVSVMKFVEIFVEPGSVIDSVMPVGHIILEFRRIMSLK